jgi:hypothetical protein
VAVGEVHERLTASLPGEYELLRWSPYKMHQRAAQRFRVGRVVLTGDAAHATNPTGGLGLTAGMLDALVLQEALAAVVSGEVGEGVLDRYAALRRDTFLNRTSPLATDYKRLVFDSPWAPCIRHRPGCRPRPSSTTRASSARRAAPPRLRRRRAVDRRTCRGVTPSAVATSSGTGRARSGDSPHRRRRRLQSRQERLDPQGRQVVRGGRQGPQLVSRLHRQAPLDGRARKPRRRGGEAGRAAATPPPRRADRAGPQELRGVRLGWLERQPARERERAASGPSSPAATPTSRTCRRSSSA